MTTKLIYINNRLEMQKNVESSLYRILYILYEECEELLSQNLLIENSFQDMYGEDVDSILSSNLFVDTHYTTFENKDIRLMFLDIYLKKIEREWKYLSFSEFIKIWENNYSSQENINEAKITLALELPDVIQGNKILRESV